MCMAPRRGTRLRSSKLASGNFGLSSKNEACSATSDGARAQFARIWLVRIRDRTLFSTFGDDIAADLGPTRSAALLRKRQ